MAISPQEKNMATVRELALELLDGGESITMDAWSILYDLLLKERDDNCDIVDAIDGDENNRVFLPPDHKLN